MPLPVDKIREILTTKPTKNRQEIAAAVRHENRLKLHNQITLSRYEENVVLTEFFDRIRTILTEEKWYTFLTMFQYPVPTIATTDRIATTLNKIFDGRNPVNDYQFTSPELRDGFLRHRNQVLKLPRFWRTRGTQAIRTAINSFIVVDMPAEQIVGEGPQPYAYFLPAKHVVDLEPTTETDPPEWIIFRQDDNRLAVYDDASYRIFPTKPGSDLIEGDAIVDSPHDLGYCPVRQFWTTPIDYSRPINKKAPTTAQLAKLDMLLYYEISNEHLQTYGRWPIYSVFKTDCDFEDTTSGHHCDGGFLRDAHNLYILDAGRRPKHCPVCSRRRMEGPGSIIEVEPPGRRNDKADLRNPVQIIGPEVTGLEYNNKDLRERRDEIYNNATGFQGLPINDQAVNREQVYAIFESLEAALKEPQKNMEAAISWTDETIARLMYGKGFARATISLGTEHYILSSAQVLEMYTAAREKNAPPSTLDLLEDKYYETEFRNNPEQMDRQNMLNDLDPFRHRTVKEVTEMKGRGDIRYTDYLIKVNFSSLIKRFERENATVTEFGQALAYDTRINTIKAALEAYAEEMKPEQQDDPQGQAQEDEETTAPAANNI